MRQTGRLRDNANVPPQIMREDYAPMRSADLQLFTSDARSGHTIDTADPR